MGDRCVQLLQPGMMPPARQSYSWRSTLHCEIGRRYGGVFRTCRHQKFRGDGWLFLDRIPHASSIEDTGSDELTSCFGKLYIGQSIWVCEPSTRVRCAQQLHIFDVTPSACK